MELSFFKKHINPLVIFLTGLSLIILYLFQDSVFLKFIQLLVFYLLAIMSGKKIKILYFILFIFFITVFELLSPWGEVLFSLGSFDITEGALLNGLKKGITFTGLVFISLFVTRDDLVLPGNIGTVLAKVFYYFEKILSNKSKINKKNLIGSIDDLLLSIYNPGNIKINEKLEKVSTSFLGWLFISGLLVFNVLFLVL